MGLPLPGLSNPLGALGLGVTPQSGGASATITGYNPVTGVVSGTAPPNLLVVVAVAGVYTANTIASASGAWSATISGASGKKISAAAVPVGTFVAVAPPFSTLDPTFIGSGINLSNANLTASVPSATNYPIVRATSSRLSGLLYFECTINLIGSFGLCNANVPSSVVANGNANSINVYTTSTPNMAFVDTSGATHGNSGTIVSGEVIGTAVDFTAGSIQFYQNGIVFSTAPISTPPGALYPYLSGGTGGITTINFGATPFAYTPPSGYSAWG